MCVRGRPIAFTALWQVVQVCGVTAAWSKRAGVQALLVWQRSQPAVVARCRAGLPVAVTPLWQLTQLPFTWVWSTVRTGRKASVVWQLWQASLVDGCPGDLPVAATPLWQIVQALPRTAACEKGTPAAATPPAGVSAGIGRCGRPLRGAV